MNSQRMVIHQFHYSVAPGDAVTNQMFFIQETLAAAGVGGEIFCKESKGAIAERVKPFGEKVWNGDLLLVHHSHGNPILKDVLRVEIPKALVYHNVTPSHFSSHDPYIAELSDLGRKQLSLFRGECVALFADSQYNAGELREAGLGDSEILPLFHLELSEKPRPAKARRGPLRLLFVGRVTTHKNQALLVEVAHALSRVMGIACEMNLVGGQDPLYGNYVRLLTRALEVEDSVRLPGKVPDEALARYFANADAFVCTSLHEGYCIPLVEAMKHRVPVFSFANTGMRETLGDAGVILKTSRPHKIAEIVAAVLENNDAVQAIRRSGDLRLKQISEIQNRERVPELLIDVVRRLRHSHHALAAPKRKREPHAPKRHPTPTATL